MVNARPRTRLHITQDLRAGAEIQFDRQQSAYLTKVLRLKDGGEIGLFNAQDGEWRAQLTIEGRREARGLIQEQLIGAEAPTGIRLAFAPIKKVPMEWLLVKATELGVDVFQPIISDHTNADLGRADRLETLLAEACEQSERCRLPELLPPVPLDTWLTGAGSVLVAAEAGRALDMRAMRSTGLVSKTLLIGPEGGFSPREINLFADTQQVHCLNLGPRILKAETAGLAMVHFAMLEAGEFAPRPPFRP